MNLRVGVVGCGLIGRRRAAVAQDLGDRVVVVADVDLGRAQALAREFGCEWTSDWVGVATRTDIDAVVVSTVNKALAPATIAALDHGEHVLCEKPLGRNSGEARQMVEAARRSGKLLKTGFNHRHHPAVWEARRLCQEGVLGPLCYVRAIYGHGGRAGYEKEWRADPDLAGGGELLDQGVHVLDLCRWILGDFESTFAVVGTYCWNLGRFPESRVVANAAAPDAVAVLRGGRQLEDNAFCLLRTRGGQVAQLHTSWTQWKNQFTFEVFGTDASLAVEGLGGSYGPERLRVTKRRKEGGIPEESVREFPGPDLSWCLEWEEFTAAISEGREPLANGRDGLEVMRLVDALYESAWTGRVVQVCSPRP